MGSRDTVEAVQRMQDYMEEHLLVPITMKQLARAAGYSPWHAARIFREELGKSPFEYLRALRLSRAALKLRDEPVRVLDVALEFVFDSHEGFTRAFSRTFGVTPSRYKAHPQPIGLFMPHGIADYYRFLENEVKQMKSDHNAAVQTVFVQIVERPARKLILKRGIKAEHYFDYCEEVGCDVWGLLTSVKEALYEPVGLWLPDSLIRPGTSRYVQGVEVPADYTGIVPEGYELIDLKPCTMMVFQGEPYEDETFGERIQEIWLAMENYDPTVYGYAWADDEAPRFQLEPQGDRGYIEARPVRRLIHDQIAKLDSQP